HGIMAAYHGDTSHASRFLSRTGGVASVAPIWGEKRANEAITAGFDLRKARERSHCGGAITVKCETKPFSATWLHVLYASFDKPDKIAPVGRTIQPDTGRAGRSQAREPDLRDPPGIDGPPGRFAECCDDGPERGEARVAGGTTDVTGVDLLRDHSDLEQPI